MAILINVSAGGYRLLGAQRLRWALRRAGLLGRVRLVECSGDGLQDAALALVGDGMETIGVLGGDGSARTVCLAVRGHGVGVLPLPGGTLNRLCHRVHGHADLGRILNDLPHARLRWLSGGLANEHVFLVASGFGPWMSLHTIRETLRREGLVAALSDLGKVRRDLFSGKLVQTGDRPSDVVIAAVGPVDAAFGLGTGPNRVVGHCLEIAQARLKTVGSASILAGAVLARVWRGLDMVETRTTTFGEIAYGGDEIAGLVDGEPVGLGTNVKLGIEPRAACVVSTRWPSCPLPSTQSGA
jgi:hypothetical protein